MRGTLSCAARTFILDSGGIVDPRQLPVIHSNHGATGGDRQLVVLQRQAIGLERSGGVCHRRCRTASRDKDDALANWVHGAVAIHQQGSAGVHAIDQVGLYGGIGDVGDLLHLGHDRPCE